MMDFVILGQHAGQFKRDITPICTIYGQEGLRFAYIYFIITSFF